jgi:hypothetical protein
MGDVFQTLNAAVINISTASIDTGGQTVINRGTGFFIYKDYVVTSASVVLMGPPREPPVSYYLQRVQRIVGVVRTKEGTAVEIELSLIGISPINDIAVLLAINPPDHGILQWGDSQNAVPGTIVYTVGNLLNEDTMALSSGVLRDNRLSYISNPNVAQLIDTNIALGGGMGGAPIVDGKGHVLGVVSFTVNWLQQAGFLISTGTTTGVSQYTAQFVFEQIAEGRYCELVIDPLGNWLRWMPTSFGADFSFIQPIDLIVLNQGLAKNITNATPDTLTGTYVLDKVQGAMITDFTPGAPLANYMDVGDIIEYVNGIPIGYQTKIHSSISTALWLIIPGAKIPVGARLKSEGYKYLRYFDIETKLMTQRLDVIYSSAQTLSTNIVDEPSNVGHLNPVAPTDLYATYVLPPSPFNGSTVPGLTSVFYPEYVSFVNATFTLQPGKYQVQVSGLATVGPGTYHLTFNQNGNVLSTITYDNGQISQGSFSSPLTNVVIFPAIGAMVVDYILDISSPSSFYLAIDSSGITESDINIFNYVPNP